MRICILYTMVFILEKLLISLKYLPKRSGVPAQMSLAPDIRIAQSLGLYVVLYTIVVCLS